MGGFEYDPDAVRGFAAVFAAAQEQVEQVKMSTGQSTARAADFGKSWAEHGGKFEAYLNAIADDLGNLATHLGEIAAALNQGTDLVVRADTAGLARMKAIEEQQPASTGGRPRPV